METPAILRSIQGTPLPNQRVMSFHDRLVVAPTPSATFKTTSFWWGSAVGKNLVSSVGQRRFIVPRLKPPHSISASTSDAITSEKTSKEPPEDKNVQKSTFPNGFEALILNVCDETSIAELKVKVGAFELHLKRDIGTSKPPYTTSLPIASPTTAPPIPSEPMVDSALPTQLVVPQKPSPSTGNPFAKMSSSKASKLAALEASGSKSYVLVSSPTVGIFRRARTLKGKKQTQSCKEGDIIKEGQTIGYLDQFGNELPIRSDVAGEVLKFLFRDGEPVGYGDPLVAVLPSFHGIRL